MITSTTLTSIGYCIVGTYSYLRSLGYNLNALGWIPILGLSLVIFVASLGILTLPYVIVAEVLPQKVRAADFKWDFLTNFSLSDKRSRQYNMYSSCNHMCIYCNQGEPNSWRAPRTTFNIKSLFSYSPLWFSSFISTEPCGYSQRFAFFQCV